ncbi:MAG: hypothetical protein P3A29_07770 [Gemmatimonadota bacterium]|jgi:hypothetical protein|nr:hypothetical protein [Gemmatimonadota bacterium]MDQ8146963.1 hypothetical protein [Gemmatimonadota bacterium]MDQ8170672.1 hypothetical protein [Gemmatimonadota bacterium]
MITTTRHLARLAGLLLVAGRLSAQTTPATGVRFLIEGAVDMGGDRLVELEFTDGTTQDLAAGQGGTIGAGFVWRPAGMPRASLLATAGFKFVSNASENADIGITRFPLRLVGRYALNDAWSLGAGVIRHGAIKVNGDGFFEDQTLTSNLGPTLELGWKAVALTYTALTYTGETGQTFDAGSIGFVFRAELQGRGK